MSAEDRLCDKLRCTGIWMIHLKWYTECNWSSWSRSSRKTSMPDTAGCKDRFHSGKSGHKVPQSACSWLGKKCSTQDRPVSYAWPELLSTPPMYLNVIFQRTNLKSSTLGEIGVSLAVNSEHLVGFDSFFVPVTSLVVWDSHGILRKKPSTDLTEPHCHRILPWLVFLNIFFGDLGLLNRWKNSWTFLLHLLMRFLKLARVIWWHFFMFSLGEKGPHSFVFGVLFWSGGEGELLALSWGVKCQFLLSLFSFSFSSDVGGPEKVCEEGGAGRVVGGGGGGFLNWPVLLFFLWIEHQIFINQSWRIWTRSSQNSQKCSRHRQRRLTVSSSSHSRSSKWSSLQQRKKGDLGVEINGFAFWSVYRDAEGPFRCCKYTGRWCQHQCSGNVLILRNTKKRRALPWKEPQSSL